MAKGFGKSSQGADSNYPALWKACKVPVRSGKMAENAPPQAKGSLCLSWSGLGSQCPSAPHVVTHVTECSSVLFAGALPSTQTLAKALALATVLEKATWSPDIQTLFPQFPLRGLPPISKLKYCRTQFSSPIFGGAYLPCPEGDALIPHACPLSGVEWSGWRVGSDCHGSEDGFREKKKLQWVLSAPYPHNAFHVLLLLPPLTDATPALFPGAEQEPPSLVLVSILCWSGPHSQLLPAPG